jgi:beta-lactamase superfamily II metal-dependent hydrolase
MSKKLKKFLNDAEKTESKIAELEEYLRNVRAAQKKEEDNEIVRAIRSTKLGGRDLLALLENIQEITDSFNYQCELNIQAGNVTFQTSVNHENKTSEEAEMEDVIAKDA